VRIMYQDSNGCMIRAMISISSFHVMENGEWQDVHISTNSNLSGFGASQAHPLWGARLGCKGRLGFFPKSTDITNLVGN